MSKLHIGWSEVNITPEKKISLAGQFAERISQYVEKPLTYLRFLIFLPAILIPACVPSSPAFLMMYSAYKLNKQGDNIQP